MTESSSANRVVDANANRAGEGLRVVEDCLRFCAQDAFLSQVCKQIRHDLATIMTSITRSDRVACRSTQTDVGTQTQTDAELRRRDWQHILFANLRRAAEAIRCLEEFVKLSSAESAQTLESLRYRLYTLEKSAGHLVRSRRRLESALLYVLVDLRYGTEEVFAGRIRALVDHGADMIQLRDKTSCDRTIVQAARRLREMTKSTDTLFVVNDRPDIARVVGCEGVHLGQEEIGVADARTIVGPDALIGVSTHSLEQARQAVIDGADYIGVGPVFASSTKSFDAYPGLDLVRQVRDEIGLPSFAIGGISIERMGEIRAAGAARVAVSNSVWGAPDVELACRKLRASLK